MHNSPFIDSKNNDLEFPYNVLIITTKFYENFNFYFKDFENVKIKLHENDRFDVDLNRFDLIWIYG